MSESHLATNDEITVVHTEVDDCSKKPTEATFGGQFIHDINDPLTALLGQVQLLLRESLSDRLRQRAEIIESQALRISEIIRSLNPKS